MSIGIALRGSFESFKGKFLLYTSVSYHRLLAAGTYIAVHNINVHERKSINRSIKGNGRNPRIKLDTKKGDAIDAIILGVLPSAP